MKYLFPV